MKLFNLGIYMSMMLLLIGCGSSKTVNSTTDTKNAIDLLVEENKFEIISDWASPLATASLNAIANSGLLAQGSSINRISLIGSSNYFKVIGDSISLHLPYFGEQRLGGVEYNNSYTGIKYDGIPDASDWKSNDKKETKTIQFNFRNRTESFRAYIVLFKNGKSNITINSSHRTQIRYNGTVSKLKENEVVINE